MAPTSTCRIECTSEKLLLGLAVGRCVKGSHHATAPAARMTPASMRLPAQVLVKGPAPTAVMPGSIRDGVHAFSYCARSTGDYCWRRLRPFDKFWIWCHR